jgi:hypothetical protein
LAHDPFWQNHTAEVRFGIDSSAAEADFGSMVSRKGDMNQVGYVNELFKVKMPKLPVL